MGKWMVTTTDAKNGETRRIVVVDALSANDARTEISLSEGEIIAEGHVVQVTQPDEVTNTHIDMDAKEQELYSNEMS